MFPTTGSTMAAAVSRPWGPRKYSRTAAPSLYGSTVVSAASAFGTPGESGRPSVSTPEPARTSSASVAPWKQPSNLTTRSRPVNARATRSADCVASVPELTKRSFRSEGTSARTFSASTFSRAVGAPKLVPSAAASAMALTMAGCACPARSGPQESM